MLLNIPAAQISQKVLAWKSGKIFRSLYLLIYPNEGFRDGEVVVNVNLCFTSTVLTRANTVKLARAKLPAKAASKLIRR